MSSVIIGTVIILFTNDEFGTWEVSDLLTFGC